MFENADLQKLDEEVEDASAAFNAKAEAVTNSAADSITTEDQANTSTDELAFAFRDAIVSCMAECIEQKTITGCDAPPPGVERQRVEKKTALAWRLFS
jgi:hypothetical protein